VNRITIQKLLSTLALTIIVIAAALGFQGQSSMPLKSKTAPIQSGHFPQTVVPTNNTINRGDSDTVTVTLDSTTPTNLVLNLSSDSNLVGVPAHVTVLAGTNSVQFQTTSSPLMKALKAVLGARSVGTLVTITASCSSGNASGGITVN